MAPTINCGSQRPALNSAPAISSNGAIYLVSRAQFADRYAYLVAVNPDLTQKWIASFRGRLKDGCNVIVPPNGTPAAHRGYDYWCGSIHQQLADRQGD